MMYSTWVFISSKVLLTSGRSIKLRVSCNFVPLGTHDLWDLLTCYTSRPVYTGVHLLLYLLLLLHLFLLLPFEAIFPRGVLTFALVSRWRKVCCCSSSSKFIITRSASDTYPRVITRAHLLIGTWYPCNSKFFVDISVGTCCRFQYD